MGFDLQAHRKDAAGFHMDAFCWPWMLDNGVGLPVGYGPGFAPAMFVYRKRPDGKCVAYNDGASVTADEAKDMAKVARWLADYQDTIYEQWMAETDEYRSRVEKSKLSYNLPVRRDFVERIRAFADWAETSGGFSVY